MHAVVRTYRHLRDFDRIARLVEQELVPLLKEVPGFRGYYAIRSGEATGVSVTLFESESAARAGHERGAVWVRAHLADHSPETLTGEVVVAAMP